MGTGQRAVVHGDVLTAEPGRVASTTRRRARLRLAVFSIVAVVAVALAVRPLLGAAGAFLVVSDPVQPAEAIAVLMGSADRTLDGVELYRAGYAPRLILTKGDPPDGFAALARAGFRLPETHELNVQIALELGVPPDAITVVGERASNTRQETRLISATLHALGLRSVIIVTSPHHTRRTSIILREVLGSDVRYMVHPSRYDDFNPRGWWRSPRQTWNVMSEYEKLLYYYLVRSREAFTGA